MSTPGLYKKLKVVEVKELIPGFKTFSFQSETPIPYKAGQYLTFVKTENGEEFRRSYSITSSPILHEALTVGIKRVPNGLFSRYFIDTIQPGDEVISIGAGGLFVLPPDLSTTRQVFLFAAGSGITPIFSLLKSILYGHPQLHVVLIYSNASPSKAIFLEEIRDFAQKFTGRFQVDFLFSNSPDLLSARLYSDLLMKLVDQYRVGETKDILFYVCGPESYMRMCTYVLQQEGMIPSQIRKENFVIPRTIVPVSPPDKETRTAIINYGDDQYRIAVAYPDAILKAAQKMGISLPYSCEAGRCGNCVAKKISGSVWHSYNEVLTAAELKQGLVLTCTAHPVGGDVELRIE